LPLLSLIRQKTAELRFTPPLQRCARLLFGWNKFEIPSQPRRPKPWLSVSEEVSKIGDSPIRGTPTWKQRNGDPNDATMTTVVSDSIDRESLRYLWTPDLESLFSCEGRVGVPSAWPGHVPFAHWIVGASKPRVIVERTHHGVSYCAFCQAIVDHGFEARCYAVDSCARFRVMAAEIVQNRASPAS